LRTLHIDTEKGWRGGEQQALYLMQGLLARGDTVHLVCRAGEPLAERAAAVGICTHPVHTRGELDPVAIARVVNILRAEHYNIVHAHTAHAHTLAVAALAACPARRRPACIVSRRVDFSIHKLPLRLSLLKYRFLVDRYIAISQCVRDVLVADGVPPQKIRVVYSAVDPGRYAGVSAAGLREELGIAGHGPILVNVAMLVDHKGQVYLLRALPEILRVFPCAMCVIVGEGELRGALEAEARSLGVVDSVLFTGFRPDPLACIAVGDVFLMTSHMEGLCTSILDALALGVPVVATRAGGIPEIIQDGKNGLLAENRNPASIAAQTIRMLREPELRARCIAAGRQTIAGRFSVSRLVADTVAVYEEVLQPKGGCRTQGGRAG